VLPLAQLEHQVVGRHLGEQRRVHQADAQRGSQPLVVLALLELALVQPGPVVGHPLAEVAAGQELHLDVELPAALVAGLDVQDGQLVVQMVLVVEGVEQLQVHDAFHR
jgi:hypothetical protein